MIKVLIKIVSLVALVALAIIAFIKLLPWCVATLALLALVKLGHDWLCHHGFPPSAWWPWKKDDGQQQAHAPQ